MASTPKNRDQLVADVIREMPRHAGSARRFHIAVAHQICIPPADLECVSVLAIEGPSSPGWLAEQLGLTTGAMTKMLDRLQKAGYITRSANPQDRRRIIVTAVPARLADHLWRYDGMGRRMNDIIARYNRTELAAILDFMERGREAADAEIALMRERGNSHLFRLPAANSMPPSPAR